MFEVYQAVSTAGFKRNQLGIVHHVSAQHGIEQDGDVHQFKTGDFAVLVGGLEAFGQDNVEDMQDFVVDTAVNGGAKLYIWAIGRIWGVNEAGMPASSSPSRQTASDGLSPLLMPPPVRLSSLSDRRLCADAAAIQKRKPYFCFDQSVQMHCLTHQAERTEGGAFECA